MREIVMDTETTGLDPNSGDRIVEIGGVELVNHLPTGRTYHQYINPKRPMPQEAFEIHGLGDEFLRDYPTFDRSGYGGWTSAESGSRCRAANGFGDRHGI